MVSIAKVGSDNDISAAMSAWSHRRRLPTVPDVGQVVSGEERDYRRRLGQAIVDLRTAAGMSQATLAVEHLNRSEAALSRWENGKATPTAYDLHVIASTFGLRSNDLHLLIYPPAVYSPAMERLFARVEAYVDEHAAGRLSPSVRAEGRQREASAHAAEVPDTPPRKPERAAPAAGARPPR